MNGDYKGTYGEVTAGYGYDRNSERLNYGLQGHPPTRTASPFPAAGETNALIKARRPRGGYSKPVQYANGLPGLYGGEQPLRVPQNDLTLDPENMPDDVELEINTRTVTPTRGAVVRADYL